MLQNTFLSDDNIILLHFVNFTEKIYKRIEFW